jgi:hypothetical protein
MFWIKSRLSKVRRKFLPRRRAGKAAVSWRIGAQYDMCEKGWIYTAVEGVASGFRIRSAAADVQKAGCVVERVQIERDSPLSSGAG